MACGEQLSKIRRLYMVPKLGKLKGTVVLGIGNKKWCRMPMFQIELVCFGKTTICHEGQTSIIAQYTFLITTIMITSMMRPMNMHVG